MINVDMDVFRV